MAREYFTTTHWGLLLAVKRADGAESRAALEELCRHYWLPIYMYIQRKGYAPAQAEDLTQGFFLSVLSAGTFTRVDPAMGRFRPYLLGALEHYLAYETRSSKREKRGGRIRTFSLDWSEAEGHLQMNSTGEDSPERIFDRHWGLAVLQLAIEETKSRYKKRNKLELFEALQSCLGQEVHHESYAEIARSVNMTEVAIKVAVHRLRREYGKVLREVVARTLGSSEEIEDEILYLFQALRK